MKLETLNTAAWIGGMGTVLLRRNLRLARSPERVVLSIVADPHSYSREYWMDNGETEYDRTWLLGGSFLKYRIFVNGILLGAGPLRPVDDPVPVLQSYDLTAAMRAGDNTVGIFCRGEQRGVRFVLEIDQEIIYSDAQWKQLNLNDIYSPVCWRRQGMEQFFKGGCGPGEWPEHIDGTRFPHGWNSPGFDDSSWNRAAADRNPLTRIEVPECANYELQTIQPLKISRLGERHYLADFGRECVGGLELTASGCEVEIRLGEELLDNGRVRFQMRTQNCYQELWQFPAGATVTLANFGLRAFRYAELIGPEKMPELKVVTVTAPFDDTQSGFRCDDDRLMRIWRFCKDTIAFTSLDVYTDCPSRERIAYEADSYITMLTHFAVEYNPALVRRTLRYQLRHQTWPQEWRSFMVPLFLEYLLYTGDIELIRQYYDELKDYAADYEVVETFARKVIVDWPVSCRDDYEFGPYCAVPNAFAAWSLEAMAELARFLGHADDAAFYREKYHGFKAGFNRVLFDTETGLYRDHAGSGHHSFHATMFALAFGLVEKEYCDRALDWLTGRGMVCSVYAAQFFLEALCRHGRYEAAMRFMTADNRTSWLGMLAQGATCAMEAWNPEQKSNASFAHPWGASPANILVRRLLGIRPLEPGWKRFSFNPAGGLPAVEGTIPCPAGAVRYRVGGGTLELVVPAGTEAVLADGRILQSGQHNIRN